jgi:hypothetical protein
MTRLYRAKKVVTAPPMKFSKLFLSAFVLFSGLVAAGGGSDSESGSDTESGVRATSVTAKKVVLPAERTDGDTNHLLEQGEQVLRELQVRLEEVADDETVRKLVDHAKNDKLTQTILHHAQAVTKSVSGQTFGAALIIIGLFVCFSGCRYFKPFVSIVSALIGAGVAHLLYGYFNMARLVGAGNSYYVEGALCIIAAVVLSVVLLKTLKLAVFVFGTAGGLVCGILLFGLGREDVFVPYGIEENTVILVCSCIGAVFSHFFEFVAIVIASGLIGSMTMGYGFDLIYPFGLRGFISIFPLNLSFPEAAKALSEFYTENSQDQKFVIASMVMVFMAVCGIYCQFRFGPRHFGRK